MSTIYRAVFSTDDSHLITSTRHLFGEWLSRKGINVDVPDSGRAECTDLTCYVEAIHAEDAEVQALRLRLDEEVTGQRWSTIVTTMIGPNEGWVWIDLERVSDDVYGPPPIIAPPGIVRSFISASTSQAGSTVLHGEYREIDEDRIDELIRELLDPERGVPIVVASRDMADPAAASVRAGALASALVGIANVWALKGTATSALSKALGPDLHVYGGAVRTYYPDLTIPDRYPRRHRFARRELFIPHPRHGAQVVARAMVTKAIAARPPILFRNRIALMPGFNRHGRDAEELLTELVAVEEERDRLQQELDWQVLEAADAADRAESTTARVKWLEKRLADAGDYVAGLETPASTMPATASDCVEALDYAKAHLDLVVIGDTLEAAEEIDQNIKAGAWGRKAWQAFRALQSYAAAKGAGTWTGNFLSFCRAVPTGCDVVPVEWVAAGESETTTNNPRFRQARTFPVPTEVRGDGTAYMEEHIKLEKGSDPAPRIHFFDDTGGGTGKVYVGYLGRHLPSFQTN